MLSIVEDFESRFMPEPNTGCWLWMGALNSAGYGQFRGEGAHRASWRIYKGPIPSKVCVLHSCDVRCCVNLDHLFLGTHSDNSIDAVNKGRGHFVRGFLNPKAVLTSNQIELIKNDARKQCDIARAFGVSEGTISRVKRR